MAPPIPSTPVVRMVAPPRAARLESVEDEVPRPLNTWAWVAVLLAALPIVPGLPLWAWASLAVAAVGCAALAENRAKKLAGSGRVVAVLAFLVALGTGGWQTVTELKRYGEEKLRGEYEMAERYLENEEDATSLGKGFALMRNLADKGHPEAQWQLWQLYENGTGTEVDLERAIKWLRTLAEQGKPEAQMALGDHLDAGRGVKQNHTEAEGWFQKALSQGHLPAKTMLAWRMATGRGGPKDLDRAVSLWQEAALQEEPGAQWYLGLVYESGEGAEKDVRKAADWYEKSAKHGYAKAQLSLAKCYQTGQGVKQDAREAVRWLQKAADQGDSQGMYQLGLCYRDGNGVEQDFDHAAQLHLEAAEQGHAASMRSLAAFHRYGHGGMEKSLQKSYEWYVRATETGDVTAFIEVALSHLLGDGVPPSEAKAREWYLRAPMEKRTPEELVAEALRYESGDGVEKSVGIACMLLSEAAVQGHGFAQGALGDYYYFGKEGAPKELTTALKLYHMAAEKGWELYQSVLGDCYQKGEGVERDLKEALQWHLKAAAQGNLESKLALAHIYADELGLRDEGEMLAWYFLAKAQMEQEKPEQAEPLQKEYARLLAKATTSTAEQAEKRVAEIQRKYPLCLKSRARTAMEPPPMATAAPRRMVENAVLVDRVSSNATAGSSKLTVENQLREDACVKVLRDGSLAASFYVRGGTKLTLNTIPPGKYVVMYCTGQEWDAEQQEFLSEPRAVRYRGVVELPPLVGRTLKLVKREERKIYLDKGDGGSGGTESGSGNGGQAGGDGQPEERAIPVATFAGY